MKKIFLALALTITLGLQAQVYIPLAQMPGHIHGLLGDTVTNTGAIYDSAGLALSYNCATIEVDLTKISGTMGGKLTIQGTNKLFGTGAWKTLNDTITVGTGSGTIAYYFQLPSYQTVTPTTSSTLRLPTPYFLPYAYYRIVWTGTGTMSGSMKSYFLGRHL